MFATMHTLRTPDERFTGIPEFPYSPKYCGVSDQDGGTLRVAWVEDGPAEGNPVLMLHPVIANAGHFLRRTRATDSSTRLFGFCESRSNPFANQQATLIANVPLVRKLGLGVSKPSAVPVMS